MEIVMYLLLAAIHVSADGATHHIVNAHQRNSGIDFFVSLFLGRLTLLTALFTFVNLSMTAAEHRRYWNSLGNLVKTPTWNVLPGVY
jgi:hypothetical protein